jgi:hypothetical protein
VTQGEIDYQGIAIVIGAVGVFITGIGTFIGQMVGLARMGKMAATTDLTHNLVNSQSEKLNKAIEARALSDGIQQGRLEERSNPMQPTPKT